MIALVIDTATERGVIALFSEEKILAQKELAIGLANSRLLLPSLHELCTLVGITPAQLSYVAVGHGPGSYTGIRAGVSCAKALAYALSIPLVGVGSLRGFVPEKSCCNPFFSVIDAKIGGVYLIKGQWNQKVQFLSQEELVSFEGFVERLSEVECIVTPNQQSLLVRLEAYELVEKPKFFEKAPSVEVLIDEAKFHFENKQYFLDGSLPLLYLRKTQAELEKR